MCLYLVSHSYQIHSSASGSDMKLRVSLDNLLEAERVGRWWIVGSSWSGAPMIDDHENKTTIPSTKGEQVCFLIIFLFRNVLISYLKAQLHNYFQLRKSIKI